MGGLTGPHPGALAFPLPAREAVGNGDPFSHRHGGEYRRPSDDRDLLAALLVAAGLAEALAGRTAGGAYAAMILGLIPAYRDSPPEWQQPQAMKDVTDLGWRGDRGEYRTREALRAALLGEGGAL